MEAIFHFIFVVLAYIFMAILLLGSIYCFFLIIYIIIRVASGKNIDRLPWF